MWLRRYRFFYYRKYYTSYSSFINEIEKLYTNVKFDEKVTSIHPSPKNKSGKSKFTDTLFEFKNGDKIVIACYDYSKDHTSSDDILAITLFLGAILFAITIIGLPITKAAIEMAKMSAFPFGKDVVHVREIDQKELSGTTAVTGTIGFIANIIWLLTFGWALF